MYESFFQFDEAPFNLTPDPRFIYLSPGHQEAFEHMLYGVEQRKGFVLIAGDIGAGQNHPDPPPDGPVGRPGPGPPSSSTPF